MQIPFMNFTNKQTDVDDSLPREILSDIIVHMKYAKYLEDKKRRETWPELVDRNKQMHLKKFPNLSEEIEEVYNYVYEKKVLPSMRTLQFAGPAIEVNPVRLYNCSFRLVDDPSAFWEILFMLLSGTGCGFSVQKQDIEKLPTIKQLKRDRRKRYLIPDSIEGWSQAVRVLVESYFEGKAEVDFDFRSIRPKGAEIVTSGGKAPGPEPLRECLVQIKSIFENALQERGEGTKLKPIEAHDIICHIAQSVLSGGIRRCLPEYAKVMTENGYKEIKDIKVGEFVYTSDGLYPVTDFFDQGVQKIDRLNTPLGSFEATKNHKMAVVGKTEPIEWKSVGELKEGDQLYFFTGIMGGNTQTLPKDATAKRPPHSTTCQTIAIPNLDEELAWVIGYFHGNGYVYNRKDAKVRGSQGGSSLLSVTGNSNAPAIMEKVKEQLDRFGINSTLKKRKKENTLQVTVHSQRLVEYFQENVKRANEVIRIPEWISKNTPEIRAAYLAGVVDSDGAINERPVRLCDTIYEDFANDLRDVYASLGIPAYVQKKVRVEVGWKDIYSVVLKFHKDKYAELIEPYSLKGALKKTRFPKGLSNVPKTLVKEYLDNKDYRKVWDGKEAMNYERFISFNKTKNVLPGMPIQITSIEREVKEIATYDIEVDSIHNFFCDGFLTHNSATISLFSIEDHEMLEAKSGNWWELHPHRGRANNTVVLERDKITKEEFLRIWKRVEASGAGEPGVMFSSDVTMGLNPCAEISLRGDNGGQFCNLVTLNGSDIAGQEDFNKRCAAGAFIATLQAGYTNFHYLGKGWQETTEEEALIGVSITGIASGNLDNVSLREGATIVKDVNEDVARRIGINKAARSTTVKPEGCQVRDTMVSTDRGIFELQEIGDVFGETWQDHEYRVYTDSSTQHSTRFFVNGSAETNVITLHSGLQLEATNQHKYRVITDNGDYVWKEAGDIEVGDVLPYSVGEYEGGQYQPLFKVQSGHYNEREIKQPATLDEDFAWLLGLYTGDGSIHTKGFRIHGDMAKQKGFDRVLSIIKDKFGIEGKVVPYNPADANERRCAVYVNSIMINRFFAANGIAKAKSKEIEIPLIIRKSPRSVIEAFLEGYATADGSDRTSTRSFCTTSRKMARQLPVILRAIGYDCKVRAMPPTSSSYGTSMRYWIQERKPRDKGFTRHAKWRKQGWASLDNKGLGHLYVDKVVSVDKGFADTFDIEVPETHTFIANSYVSHNTASIVAGCSSGIHAWHNDYYIRRVRVGKNEAIYNYLKDACPAIIEDEFFQPESIAVISVPQKAPEGAKLRTETALETLERVRRFNTQWVHEGHREGNNRNNVSCTISVKDNEWQSVAEWMWENRNDFTAISVLPYDGGTYKQAPFEDIDKKTYEELVKNLNGIDLRLVIEEEDNTDLKGEIACGGGACEIT